MSLRDKMLAVIDDVNGSVAERGELVEIIAIALLTRKNLFVLGDPGQARAMPSTFSASISPARGSLSACSPNRPTKNSFLAALTFQASSPGASRTLRWRVTMYTGICALI